MKKKNLLKKKKLLTNTLQGLRRIIDVLSEKKNGILCYNQ
jgi:hypothetical protein